MDERPDPTQNPTDPGETGENSRGGKLRTSTAVLALLAVIAMIVIALDVATKSLVVAFLDPERPVHIIGDAVTLRLVRNSGAAFSMASGYTWVLTLIALAVVVVIIRFSGRLRSGWWVLGLGLVLGGAIGNLIDRILLGHVVDFIQVSLPFIPLDLFNPWPAFNIADSAITLGVIILLIATLIADDTANRSPSENGV